MMNDYPTEKELEELKNFNVINDIDGFLESLETLWNVNYGKFELTGKKVKKLRLITGGWSGNEDILGNIPIIFDSLYWQKSIRGGLIIYKIHL